MEEMQEREVVQDVVKEVKVSQVIAKYPYKGQAMEMQKGDVRYSDSLHRCWLLFDSMFLSN